MQDVVDDYDIFAMINSPLLHPMHAQKLARLTQN